MHKNNWELNYLTLEKLANQEFILLSDFVKPEDFSKKYAVTTDYIIYDNILEKYYRPIITTSNELQDDNVSTRQIPILSSNDFTRRTDKIDILNDYNINENHIFIQSSNSEYPTLMKANNYMRYNIETPYQILNSKDIKMLK